MGGSALILVLMGAFVLAVGVATFQMAASGRTRAACMVPGGVALAIAGIFVFGEAGLFGWIFARLTGRSDKGKT